MLFGNRFEKNLFDRYIVQPFDGFSVDRNTAFFDLLCDFCSSVAHNGVVFPRGISKPDYAKVFYSCYALGIMLSCSGNESKSQEISRGAVQAFNSTARQNGMGQQQIMDRLSYVLNCFDGLDKALDSSPSEKQGAYVAMAFLSQMGIKPIEENIYAM